MPDHTWSIENYGAHIQDCVTSQGRDYLRVVLPNAQLQLNNVNVELVQMHRDDIVHCFDSQTVVRRSHAGMCAC